MLLPLVGLAWLFYLNAVSFGLVVLVWLVTRIPALPPAERRRPWLALRDGLAFARLTPAIAVPVTAAAVVGGIGLSYSPQIASYASEFLAAGDEVDASRYYGFMQFSIGLGAIVGIMVLPRVASRHPGTSLVAGVLGFSTTLVLLGVFTSAPIVIVICLLLGAFQFATGAHALNVIQHHAPEEMRGRLVSLHQMAWIGLFPIIGLVSGWIATFVGLRLVFIGTGLVCAVAALPVVRRRHEIGAPPSDRPPILGEPGGPDVQERPSGGPDGDDMVAVDVESSAGRCDWAVGHR